MRTLTIRINDDERLVEKRFPLEPFQAMTPEVAADGFMRVVRELLDQINGPKGEPMKPLPKDPREGVSRHNPVIGQAPVPAGKPAGPGKKIGKALDKGTDKS